MSFRTNKPMSDGVPQSAGSVLGQPGASVPAFKPQVMRSVRMHPLLAGVVGAVVFGGLVGYALLQKPLYSAESLIYLEPMTPKLVNDGNPSVFDSTKYEAFVGEQTQLMQRADVLTAAMNSLPQTTWAGMGPTPQIAANTLQGQLKVQRVMQGYQVSIGLKGSDPEKTAAIVNAVAAAYMKAVHKATAEESDVRAQLLAEERDRIEGELKAARSEQTMLGASIGVANPTGEGGNPYDAELSGIRTQLMEARAAHDVAAAQLASISRTGSGRNSGLAVAADDLMAGDPGLGTTKATIAGRKATLNAQMAGLTAANPIYKQDQDEIADLDRTLDAATTEARGRSERKLQDKLKTDLDRTGDIEARLNGELSRQIMNATSAAPKMQRASEVAADIQRLDIREAAVDDTLRSLRMQQTGPGQVRIALAASVPASPEPNRTKLLLLAALPLALLLAGIAAVLARKQDKRLYGPIDLEDVLGFPPLAVLPARSDVADRVFEEYLLRLAAGIEGAYRTNGARTFLLTAVSLTTDIRPLAAALARKFDDIGVHVVVATASELLAPTESVSVEDEQKTAAELARTVELWREGFVAANMARMKTEHALVLIEAEALLNCGQTEYVARCADATILIIESGVTTREELHRAAELLERLNVTGIGAVLEGLRLRVADRAFRTAVSAVDRRQAETRYEQPRTMRPRVVQQQVVVKPMEQPVRVAEVEQPRVEEVLPVAEPVIAEPVVARAVEVEAPVVVEEKLPEVAAAARAVHEVAEVVGRPVLVDHGVAYAEGHDVSFAEESEENLQEEPLIALANGTTHEKMSSTLSGRRLASGPVGDATMNRKASWLDRLLRRDADAASFRIVPDDDEDDSEVAAKTAPQTGVETKPEDYDLPLANRLEQISRMRPAVQGTAYNSGTRGTRLQIVPQEAPPELVVPALESARKIFDRAALGMLPETVETQAEVVSEKLEAVAPEVEPIAAEVVTPVEAWHMVELVEPVAVIDASYAATEPEVVPEPVVETPVAVAPLVETPKPVVAAVATRGPRRPFSFQELVQGVPQQEVAVVVEQKAEWHEPAALAVEKPAVEIPGLVEEIHQPVEVAEHIAAPLSYEDVTAPFWEPAAVQPEPVEGLVAETPVPAYQEPVQVEPLHMEPEVAAEQVAVEDSYDVEPVYQEASRHLTTGRWDPIPTLRPAENGNGGRSTWPREESAPGQGFGRWIPEDQPVAAAASAETEPLLSRQWGLLSKFQQARKTSGERPAVANENEPLREPSNRGQRQN